MGNCARRNQVQERSLVPERTVWEYRIIGEAPQRRTTIARWTHVVKRLLHLRWLQKVYSAAHFVLHQVSPSGYLNRRLPILDGHPAKRDEPGHRNVGGPGPG